ncbi:hypothetical protein F7734_49380 [Scytonema sp. UIC 10036]|uniref:ParE family toxin-like protein n=1 Tax=Scytonema sp. UIC 10036 TaxID=2304196 RepID=UPI00137F0DC5|nr:hypothetical protein [Scytonema sp. UIC 10036]MUG99866.1 hypothetical protein [Scytonema sp. UIC 10036]
MKSRITPEFRHAFGYLPEHIQERTREAYRQFKKDPTHPSLHFKKVNSALCIYSARISKNYRAVGLLRGDIVIWF